jgi:hypothetical protein
VEVLKRVAKEQKGVKTRLLAAVHGHSRLSTATGGGKNMQAFMGG